jgi:hypothetical protein
LNLGDAEAIFCVVAQAKRGSARAGPGAIAYGDPSAVRTLVRHHSLFSAFMGVVGRTGRARPMIADGLFIEFFLKTCASGSELWPAPPRRPVAAPTKHPAQSDLQCSSNSDEQTRSLVVVQVETHNPLPSPSQACKTRRRILPRGGDQLPGQGCEETLNLNDPSDRKFQALHSSLASNENNENGIL